jgi:hypothetical protein
VLLPYATRAAVMTLRAIAADKDLQATCDRIETSVIRLS